MPIVEKQKATEIAIASQFLGESRFIASRVCSLADYVGRQVGLGTSIRLDNVLPDVVADFDGRGVGIELSAYSTKEPHNPKRDPDALIDFMFRVSEHVEYTGLKGIVIYWDPRLDNVPPKSKAGDFVKQLCSYARAHLLTNPLVIDEQRDLPELTQLPGNRPFQAWPLLEQHVSSISINRPRFRAHLPLMIPASGWVSLGDTSFVTLAPVIERKAKKLAKSSDFVRQELDEVWLLIHAHGWSISSKIAPLCAGMIEDLLNSAAALAARSSGFNRVYFWNGLHGGFVELIGGLSAVTRRGRD